MTPDFQERWLVQIGDYYVAGLGMTSKGYGQHGEPNRVVPGIVITGVPEHAMSFTSRRTAYQMAKRFGGRAVRV